MYLKLIWYQYKLDCYNFRMLYVIPIVTMKKIFKEYKPKEVGREAKCVTTKYQLNIKEGSSGGNEGQKNIKTYRR